MSWQPPQQTRPNDPPRAPACVCAICRQPGRCDDYDKVDGRWVHKGRCAERLKKKG